MDSDDFGHCGPHRHRHRHRFGALVSLLELKNGQRGVVALLQGNKKVVQRLSELGIVPDTVVEVINSAPLGGPVEVLVRGSRLAIGREVARGILVRVEEG
ncbi:MAG: hypothetical protein B9J98_04630 [Candidatus Terraquivivens tikiterensis]|uniref:Ferrous iron transporter FeoA-like domain-containing protein n=1 Tax=Candidatus Terraquivivens tikiterensis TaxID=1980982 RepID=A0A2R7Y3I9_9ARCH|nr:MAG: hypothetical protein B9J98_04630 [Candidatus Terraquivivens tikiterensis]